jgi:hypothetical protein
LIKSGCHEAEGMYASLLFIGESFDPALPANAPRRTWTSIIKFIYERFAEFRRIKADHEQWDTLGHQLWKYFEMTGNEDAFVSNVRFAMGLGNTP